MTYQQAVLSLLTIAILSVAVHEIRSQVRHQQVGAQLSAQEPAEVRVVRVDRDALGQLLATDVGAARDMLGLESRVVDLEAGRALDVRRRLAPLARGHASEVVLSLREDGASISVVVIAI